MNYDFSYERTELIIRDRTAERHYRTIDPKKLAISSDHATIIGISGNGTTDLKAANGFAKTIQTHLDLMFKTKDGKDALNYVDIFSVKYATKMKNYDSGYMTKVFADELTDAMIKILTDKNGHPLPVDQAKQNFSRITFFTYCQGSLCLNDIVDLLDEKLVEIGYTTEEIIAINNASMEVAFAGPNPVENRIPSVRVLSLNDPVVSTDLDYLESHDPKIQNLDGMALHQDQPGYLYGKHCEDATAPSIQIISSNLIDTEHHGFHLIYNDHNIKCVSFNKNWELNPCEIDNQTFIPKNAKCAAESIAIATCFGVAHSLNNLNAQTYQPQPWQALIDDLQFNINSYTPKKLSQLNTNFNGLKTEPTKEK